MTKEEQKAVLEKHFNGCLRFWERELKTDSDLDKQPYINAIKEIPVVDPTCPCGKPLDKDIREEFIKSRFMDCYGKEWERYYKTMRHEIRDVN